MILAVSEEEFLEGEQIGEVKHQLIDGVAYAMAGAKANHQRICTNLIRDISFHLKGGQCEVFSADMLVKSASNFFYPDVMVVCDFDTSVEVKSQPRYTQKPVIIVEVLSDSTRRMDLTTKRMSYINIPTLKEYVIIEQNFVSIEVLRKSTNWQAQHYSLDEDIYFESIDLTLSVAEIYERVDNEDMAVFNAERA